jgi:hypothetical protein
MRAKRKRHTNRMQAEIQQNSIRMLAAYKQDVSRMQESEYRAECKKAECNQNAREQNAVRIQSRSSMQPECNQNARQNASRMQSKTQAEYRAEVVGNQNASKMQAERKQNAKQNASRMQSRMQIRMRAECK